MYSYLYESVWPFRIAIYWNEKMLLFVKSSCRFLSKTSFDFVRFLCVHLKSCQPNVYHDAGFKVELVKMVVDYSSRKFRFDIDKIRWEWDKMDIVCVCV